MQDIKGGDLLTMASIDPTEPECKNAFNEFHRRYKDFIWQSSCILAKSIDIHNIHRIAMVFTQNTIMDVYKNAGKFESRSEDDDRDIKVWLHGIIKNKGKQYIAENNRHKEHIVFMEVVEDEHPVHEMDAEEYSSLETYEQKLLRRGLKSLSERQRQVLLAWYNFSDNGKILNVDKTVKENLAKQFNVKVDSLKQIKKRAFDNLMLFINTNTKN